MRDNLTHIEKRILLILQRKWRWWAGGNSWISYKDLSEEINRPLTDTKLAVRRMEKKGIVKHQWMVDDDCQPAGSGYFLTPTWDT